MTSHDPHAKRPQKPTSDARTVHVPTKKELDALKQEGDQSDVAAQQLDRTADGDDTHAISKNLPDADLEEIVDKGMTPGD